MPMVDGASLFYTSFRQPKTITNLRHHILRRLMLANAANKGSTATKDTIRNQPDILAEVAEKDTVQVPAGWDSFGKIRVLRESFDCEGFGEGRGARAFESALLNPDSQEVRSQRYSIELTKVLIGEKDCILAEFD
jgi:hypothetical protein